jgi:catechol 2,3-dioxygenase-like lactoylglutathione lyase family enzyme
VVVLPVSDVDRARDFYATALGSRLDADVSSGDDFRVVQVTPPGSPAPNSSLQGSRSASGRRSYGSFASFEDPDGTGWLLQENTTRLPGR